jgi:uncharacterized protein YndB with AHSA1/START domain
VVLKHRLEIDAPIGRVFALVDDPEKIKLWMRGLEETVYASEPNRADPVGTRFTQRIRQGRRVAEYEGVVTAYDKPRHLAVRIGNEKFAFDVDYRFTDLGGRTQLDYTASGADPTGVARPAGAFFAWVTRRIAAKQMRRLKKAAETGAS